MPFAMAESWAFCIAQPQNQEHRRNCAKKAKQSDRLIVEEMRFCRRKFEMTLEAARRNLSNGKEALKKISRD
jgi:hypothetical protein